MRWVVEPDPALCVQPGEEKYHRCDVRWFVKSAGGMLDSEDAKVMRFVFSTRRDLKAAEVWCHSHGVRTSRLRGVLVLVVKCPYSKRECADCLRGAKYPPRKNGGSGFNVKRKKFKSREEMNTRKWRKFRGSSKGSEKVGRRRSRKKR